MEALPSELVVENEVLLADKSGMLWPRNISPAFRVALNESD